MHQASDQSAIFEKKDSIDPLEKHSEWLSSIQLEFSFEPQLSESVDGIVRKDTLPRDTEYVRN